MVEVEEEVKYRKIEWWRWIVVGAQFSRGNDVRQKLEPRREPWGKGGFGERVMRRRKKYK